ncbi:Formylglycine-generating sulfatase enzyme [Rhodopirellula baltica SH28]|uniref:Formylglycine-generating sulfatase enzyme n=2 Tax=Rhodopirellula baltica TaxID=265606 RepID=K5CH73_RHOBT|nr:Formylglycine-generating sulfatase enzyme [Rhodopirellula baltica SH28]
MGGDSKDGRMDPFRPLSLRAAMLIWNRFVLISLVLASCPLVAEARGPESRVQSECPTDERSVKTARGFMVAYTQRIPGTNVEIEMVPVAGGTIDLKPPSPTPWVDASGVKQSEATLVPPIVASDPKVQTVAIEPFWMGKLEITMEQYMPYRQLYYAHKKAAFRKGYQRPGFDEVDGVTAPTDVYDYSINFEFAGASDSPVPTTSQFAARQYTKWLSLVCEVDYRLPLRSEWQHACVSGQKPERLVDDVAVHFENTEAVDVLLTGSKAASSLGLHDMQGNVSEWVIEDTATTGLFRGHVAIGGNFNLDAKDCQCDSMLRSTEDWWDEDPDFPPSPWWATSDESRATGFRIISPLMQMSEKQRELYWEADSDRLREDVESRVESGRGSFGLVKP